MPFEVKGYSLDGDFKSRFQQGDTPELAKFATSWSIAVDSQGGIFLSQPRNENLLTAYDSRGRKLRGVGEKLEPEKVYPEVCKTNPRCQDRRYRVTLNRVKAAVDGDDNLYVGFDVAPIVRRYDSEGRLIFETRLEGGHVDAMVELQWETPKKWWDYYSYNLDGVQALTIVNGLTVDPATGKVYCLVGSRAIYVLAPDGRQIAVLNQSGEEPLPFDSVSVSGRDGYLTNWGGIFHFVVEETFDRGEMLREEYAMRRIFRPRGERYEESVDLARSARDLRYRDVGCDPAGSGGDM